MVDLIEVDHSHKLEEQQLNLHNLVYQEVLDLVILEEQIMHLLHNNLVEVVEQEQQEEHLHLVEVDLEELD